MKSESFFLSRYGSARAKSVRRRPAPDAFSLESLERRRLLDATSATALLDASFGQGGAAAPMAPGMTGIAGDYQKLTPAGDGKFYAIAYDAEPTYNLSRSAFELMRINADGSLDSSFGNGGAVRVTRYDPVDIPVSWFSSPGTYHSDYDALTVGNVMVQPDGKVLLTVQAVPHGPPDPWLLMRFNTDGSTDTGFGDAGTVTLPVTAPWNVPVAWFQPDGKIDLIGADGYRDPGASENAVIQQFNADGSPDATFGVGGQSAVTFQPNEPLASDASASDSYMLSNVVGGIATSDGGSIVYLVDRCYAENSQGSSASLIAMHLDSGGNLTADSTIYSTGSPQQTYTVLNASVQSDGSVVLVDSSQHLMRFNADGSPDTAFDANAATESIPSGFSIQAINVEADGEILVTVSDSSGILQGLQRLNKDGSTDAAFAGGETVFNLGDHESIGEVLTMADGSMIVSINDQGWREYDTTALTNPKGAQLIHLQVTGGAPGTFDEQSAEAAVIIATTPPPPPPQPDPVPVDDCGDSATGDDWTDPTTDDGSSDAGVLDDGSGDDSIDDGQGDPNSDPYGGDGWDGSQDSGGNFFDSAADSSVWNPDGTQSVFDGGSAM